MTVRRHVAALCGVVLLAFATDATAQGVQTGALRGSVAGPDGAPVANAEITVASPALQGGRDTRSDARGLYVIRDLPPGDYSVRVVVAGSEVVRRETRVPLGGVSEVNVTLRLANVAEAVTVAAPVLTSTTGGANYTHPQIDALATPRTISGIARFAPGVSDAVATAGPTEGQGQVAIHGGLAYDNVFLVNGVDIGDNIFVWPQNLFIEDAIVETQVLTSGISAEYGRFGGGVVNAITRSGGNSFSGSYRLNLANEAWSTETPFERDRGVLRRSRVNSTHEGTVGGPILRDRVWFFLAGRYADVETTPTLPVTGVAYETRDRNERGEVKVTATVAAGHTVSASALGNPRTQTSQANFAGGLSTIDRFALSDKKRPNHLLALTYRGVLDGRVLLGAQYSHQQFATNSGGGTSTALTDSPFLTLDFARQYNAPYFSASDPDRRNNRQLTGSVSSVVAGHELKAGYEWFRSQKVGGNSPSPSGYVFQADYLEENGVPVLDAQGRLQPVFAPGDAYVLRFIATPGAEMNIDHHSAYVQDRWTAGPRIAADLGVRFERVTSDADGAASGIHAGRALPRLGVSWDVAGSGGYVLQSTYGHYSGRYSDALFVRNGSVGNPIEIDGEYVGPEGVGLGFASGFDLNNYDFENVFALFPSANVRFDPDIASPLTREFTVSAGAGISRGSVHGSYVWRRTRQLVEDFISLENGTTVIDQPGVDLTLVNRDYRNTDLARRDYQAFVFQGGYDLGAGVTLNGHWTVQLENDGNYEGEAPNQIVTSAVGDYPEIFTEPRHYPTGRLPGFQRHKMHLWSVYGFDLGRFGDGTVSGLWRYHSARTYSLRAIQSTTVPQLLGLIGAGYPIDDLPGRQTVYYGPLGSESFAGYGLVDLSASYEVPVFRALRPWVKADLYNALNNQKLISWNTSISGDPASPLDALGLRTGYREGSQFGRATSNTHFPVPFAGATGGRTLRLAVGVRF